MTSFFSEVDVDSQIVEEKQLVEVDRGFFGTMLSGLIGQDGSAMKKAESQ